MTLFLMGKGIVTNVTNDLHTMKGKTPMLRRELRCASLWARRVVYRLDEIYHTMKLDLLTQDAKYTLSSIDLPILRPCTP